MKVNLYKLYFLSFHFEKNLAKKLVVAYAFLVTFGLLLYIYIYIYIKVPIHT